MWYCEHSHIRKPVPSRMVWITAFPDDNLLILDAYIMSFLKHAS